MCETELSHYNDVVMSAMASQIFSFTAIYSTIYSIKDLVKKHQLLTIVYSIVYSGVDQRKHQSSASLAFARGIHRRPVNSPHKGPVTRKLFPFDDVIMFHLVTAQRTGYRASNSWKSCIFLTQWLTSCSLACYDWRPQGGGTSLVFVFSVSNIAQIVSQWFISMIKDRPRTDTSVSKN